MQNIFRKLIPGKLQKAIGLNGTNSITYICPFCNHSSKELSMIGMDFPVLKERQVIGGGRRLGGCQQCGSSDRERLMYVYLKERVGVFENRHLKILHIAPERYLTDVLLALNFDKYICGDLFAEGYTYPEHVQNINIMHIPFSDNSFDLVICNHVLEHIPDDAKAMKELYRVLKPGGEAILQVPISANSAHTFEDFSITDPKQREQVFGQFDHIRIYGQDYASRLASCGFKVNRINLSHEFRQYGLNLDEDVFSGGK